MALPNWTIPCTSCLHTWQAPRPKKARHALVAAWTPECEEGFMALKSKPISAPVLAYADFPRPFIVEIDRSHDGLGAVLSQQMDNGVKPMAYGSRVQL